MCVVVVVVVAGQRGVRDGVAGGCVRCLHQHGGSGAGLLSLPGGSASHHRGVDGRVAPPPQE